MERSQQPAIEASFGEPMIQNKEVGELKSADNSILPAWFTHEMMNKPGTYGLMMRNQTIIAISEIKRITEDAQGHLWLDVSLLSSKTIPFGDNIWGAPGRLNATVNARQIVLAFDLSS